MHRNACASYLIYLTTNKLYFKENQYVRQSLLKYNIKFILIIEFGSDFCQINHQVLQLYDKHTGGMYMHTAYVCVYIAMYVCMYA